MRKKAFILLFFCLLFLFTELGFSDIHLSLKILDENGAPIAGAIIWYRRAGASGSSGASGLPNNSPPRESGSSMMLCPCSPREPQIECNYSGPTIRPSDYYSNVEFGKQYKMEIRITKKGYNEIKDTFSWIHNTGDECIYRTYILEEKPNANQNIQRSIERNSNAPTQPSLVEVSQYCDDLCEACVWGTLGSVQEALKKGANINCRYSKGLNPTPLICAVSANSLEIARFLLEKGADVNLPNGEGETALSVALRVRPPYQELVNLLIRAGARR